MNEKSIAATEIPQEPIIQCRNLTKIYTVGENKVVAINDVNVDIYPGEFVGIVGKSGAGKSSLLNMMSGVDHLSGGEVYVSGKAMHKLNETYCSKWRGKKIGVIYQSFQLLPMLTLLDNVMFPMDFLGTYHPIRSVERGLHLLEQMQLADHALKYPSQISGGQQQRVAIARALANDVPILLADEPTGSLDSLTADTIMKVFAEIIQQGKTIVMATHDSTLSSFFSRLLIITDGEITQ